MSKKSRKRKRERKIKARRAKTQSVKIEKKEIAVKKEKRGLTADEKIIKKNLIKSMAVSAVILGAIIALKLLHAV